MISPHTLIESPFSGSTPEAFVDRAVALGRTHLAYTDPAYMTALYRVFDYAKKKNVKVIPGVTVYFKDDTCEFTKHTKARYFNLTLYAPNQEILQKMFTLISKPRQETESYGLNCPLWNWSDLEEAAAIGLHCVSAGVHDLVAKQLLIGSPSLAEPILKRLHGIFGDRYSLCVVGSELTHSYMNIVKVTYTDGTFDTILGDEKTTVHFFNSNPEKKTRGIKVNARDLAGSNRFETLVCFLRNGAMIHVNKKIQKAEEHQGFFRIAEYDLQKQANLLFRAFAEKHGVRLLYSDQACYAEPEDKIVQDIRLLQDGYKEYPKRHMQTEEEALSYLQNIGLGSEILAANQAWASNFDLNLKFDYQLVTSEKNAYETVIEIIKKNGRLKKDDAYVGQLRHELNVISKNGKIDLLPYFLPIVDVVNHYHDQGMITGPGRGSAGGSLLAYLLGITHVDPLKYGLSFERFFSLDRALAGTIPDIDTDFPSRELLVGEDGQSGFLYGKYGNRAAQISTRTLLRLKSAIKDVNRALKGEVEAEIEHLSKVLPAPINMSDDAFVFGYTDSEGVFTKGLIDTNDDLKKYIIDRPAEWAIVQRALSISKTFSKHASAFVIADKPISNTTPTFMGGNVTQFDAKGVEKSGLIKYDFLVVHQLADIQNAIMLINKKETISLPAGEFMHKGQPAYIWNLPEDPEVFKSIWEGATETLFQISTSAMLLFVKKIKPESIEDLSAIIAVVRPGTLDATDEVSGLTMADEYVERRWGVRKCSIPELEKILPETHGIILYQEQATKICKELAMMNPLDAENLRRALSKKKKEEVLAWKKTFMEGATRNVSAHISEQIWAQVEAGSRYSFNKSHSVQYAMITYACMFLKHYYPLEWWAAVLSNAKEEEISNRLYKHVRHLLDAPDINLSTDKMEIDYDRGRIVSKLSVLRGLGDKFIEAAIQGRPYKDVADLVRKRALGDAITKKLIHAGVMDSLFPANTSLLDKMYQYETAKNLVDYEEKVAQGKKPNPPKAGVVDEDYLNPHPLDSFKRKKEILPTMPLALSRTFVDCTSVASDQTRAGRGAAVFMNHGSKEEPAFRFKNRYGRYDNFKLYVGERIRLIESDNYEEIVKQNNLNFQLDAPDYFCGIAYVIKVEEKPYDRGRKKRLIMNLDFDGYITEKILWPDYNSGILTVPEGLKKGSIILLFMVRNYVRAQTNIWGIEVVK